MLKSSEEVSQNSKKTWRRDIVLDGAKLIIAALLALVGWGLVDRLHWAGNERQIVVNTERLTNVEGRLNRLPEEAVSRQEWVDHERRIENQHHELMQMMSGLSQRIDNLTSTVKTYSKTSADELRFLDNPSQTSGHLSKNLKPRNEKDSQ